jgi:cryptochrome
MIRHFCKLGPKLELVCGDTLCYDIANVIVYLIKNTSAGYPFIDAIMTQLRTEGWIHHLARHAVACFLTRGDLWQSWEVGQRVFDRLLLDADFALNAGNWQWLSASAFYHQYFRVYSPVAFGKKTDPTGAYIRKYLPALANLPAKFLYAPWEAPLLAQRSLGCIVGEHYPKPIVEHATVLAQNMARMKAVYGGSDAAADADEDTSGMEPPPKRAARS